jgi:hypothetical protein
VDDALLVRGLERFRNLLRDGQRFVDGDRPLRDAVSEGRPFAYGGLDLMRPESRSLSNQEKARSLRISGREPRFRF